MNDPINDAPAGDDVETSPRLRSTRRSLATTLIVVALIAVAVLGIVNIIYSRNVLNTTIETQLSSISAERSMAVRDGVDRLRSSVSAIANDRSVGGALVDFTAGFGELNDGSAALEPSQEQALEAFYTSTVEALPDSSTATAASLLPKTVAGRYLQYHYIVENPFPAGERDGFDDAGDGSAYSTAHATHNPVLVQRAKTLGVDDLLLISDAPVGTIVYSTAKNIDFATSLESGPYAGTNLATTILDRLDTVPVGDTIIVDFEEYLPNDGRPTLFAAAAVRLDSQVIGAVAVALPEGVLDQILTFDERWQDIGLGKSGEVYIVGADRLMRSVSRFWVEDPDAYLAAVDDQDYPPEVGETIRRYGNTVMAQPVDTKAVNAALEDLSYNDTTKNYLGEKTRTIARPLRFPDLNWVIVTGFASSDATRPIRDYIWSLGFIALIIVPIVGLLGLVMAQRLTSPIQPLVEAVGKITDGDLDTRVPDLGRNEYGDLGNRINALTGKLRDRDEQRRKAEEEIHEILAAALPPSIVDAAREAARSGRPNGEIRVGELLDTATIITLSLSGYFDVSGGDAETAVDESVELASDLEEIAARFSIERIRSTADGSLFAAGLRSPTFAADDAVRFTRAMIARLEVLDDETEPDGFYRIALASGKVASGIQPGDQLSIGIWGEPVRTAFSLVGIAGDDQVLIDESTASHLDDDSGIEPIVAVDLQGNEVRCYTLVDGAGDGSPAPADPA